MSNVRPLDGGRPSRLRQGQRQPTIDGSARAELDEAGDASSRQVGAASSRQLEIQKVQSSMVSPEATRASIGLRDPWLLVGAMFTLVSIWVWNINPPSSGTSTPLVLRLAMIVVAGLPVVSMAAWLGAVLTTRAGPSRVGAAVIVGVGGFWLFLLAAVIVYFGAEGANCPSTGRCPTSGTDRLVMFAALAGCWAGGRILFGAQVRRRVGAVTSR